MMAPFTSLKKVCVMGPGVSMTFPNRDCTVCNLRSSRSDSELSAVELLLLGCPSLEDCGLKPIAISLLCSLTHGFWKLPV